MIPGTLRVNNLRCQSIIGIHPHERIKPQSVELSLAVDVDFEPSAAKAGTFPQDTSTTVDWSLLAERAQKMLVENKYYLAETACVDIAQDVLKDSRVLKVWVKISKLEIGNGVGSVSAEVTLP